MAVISTLKYPIRKRKISLAPYIFISPFFLIFSVFLLFPILYTGYISFHSWDGFTPRIFTGIANYLTAVRDPRFLRAISNTLLLMLMIIPIQITLGFLVANILSSKVMIWRKSFRLFNFLPFLTAPISLGVIFAILFDPIHGPINYMLGVLGIEGINWHGHVWAARILVASITIWRFFGYTAVLYMAGITSINPDLFEAADIEGVNAFQKIVFITLPALKPVSIFIILTTMIGCFQIFEEPFLIFDSLGARMVGGPDNAVLTAIWFYYDTAFRNMMRFGYASSVAFVLFGIIAVMSLSVNKILNRGGD